MKNRILQILILIIALNYTSCQEINLQKDGFFILKENNDKVTYDKCFYTRLDDSGSIINIITAYDKKENDSINPVIQIHFNGTDVGTYDTYDSLAPTKLLAIINFEGTHYEFPSFTNGQQTGEMSLVIDKYDTDKGIIKGSVSGKFYSIDKELLDVEESDFESMDSEQYDNY
jgi:hypothetical protein